MSKSLSKTGFTLVEVLCSLGVFSIIFVCMMSFDGASLKMQNDVRNINNNVLVMEAIKNKILYSMTFNELEQLTGSNGIYINKENMNFDKSKTDIRDVFTKSIPNQTPYIKLSLIKDQLNVYKLNLLLNTGKVKVADELQCNFYKGDHE